MAKAIFLFDGGNYKRGIDSGRSRVPLNDVEAQAVFYDPEVPKDTDNSIGSQLAMSRYADQFCDLEVGDEIFVALAPDAVVYRGLGMMSFDKVDGFQVRAEIVRVIDVHANIAGGGDGTGVAVMTGTSELAYDFSNGMCEAMCDALDLADLWGGAWSDYRNTDAAKMEFFHAPVFAGLGESVYLRMTVTALGEFGTNSEGQCGSCDKPVYPEFQIIALYDRLCFDKGRIRNYCNCNDSLCGGGCDPTTTTTTTTTTTAAPTTTTTTTGVVV